MKPAVGRIAILPCTIRTHSKPLHRGFRAIVGKCLDDAEPRSAVGTISKRVSISAVSGIENFSQTIGACGDIREDQRDLLSALFAEADFKLVVANAIEKGGLDALDDRERRLLVFEALQKFV